MTCKRFAAFTLAAALPACAFVLPGCVSEHERPKKIDLGVAPQQSDFQNSAAYRDTIGSYAYFEGLTPMRVRGYGLVVGLGTNGSRNLPPKIRDRLVQSLYKRHRFVETKVGVNAITPEQLIRDVDTAVVFVQGDIPPAAVRGARFDVGVMAVPGTETKSLRGGHLFMTELEMFRTVSPRAAIRGRTLAEAAGPVFFNPFADETSATGTTLTEGTIGNGGVVTEDRRIRLVLVQPSYLRATQIQSRINAHFAGPEKTADATSPSFVRLRVPPEFADDTTHFLGLVRHLYLSNDPSFEAQRSQMLEKEMKSPGAPHAQIALAFEGMGRDALTSLERLYGDANDAASFYAAAAGLRLDDHLAVDAMARHTLDEKCAFRYHAIRGLARATGMGGATVTLHRLLQDTDPRVQAAAYEALLFRQDRTIRSTPVGDGNFVLDQIPTDTANFVYVKRSGDRRIALFGRNIACMPPVFYMAPNGSITIDAKDGDRQLTLLRRVVATGTLSPAIPASLELPALIRLLGNQADVDHDNKVTGLGLDYSAVTLLLYHLCRDRSINASFILEVPNVAELFGPPRPTTRPESEP